MKTLLLILATLAIISCSKKDDPQPVNKAEPKPHMVSKVRTDTYNYFIDNNDTMWAMSSGKVYKKPSVKYFPYRQPDILFDTTRYLQFHGFNFGNYQHVCFTANDISGTEIIKDSVKYIALYPFYVHKGYTYILRNNRYVDLRAHDANYQIDALEVYNYSIKLDTATFVNTVDSTDIKVISFWLGIGTDR